MQVTTDRPEDADIPIELVLPAEAEMLRVARLVASGVASLGGFDVEEIEDLRIGVDELCTVVITAAPQGRCRLRFYLGDRDLVIEARVDTSDDIDPLVGVDLLSDRLLGVVTDDHSWHVAAGTLTARMRKRSVYPRIVAV